MTRDMPEFKPITADKEGFRGQALEAMGSTVWTCLFLSYFSRGLTRSWGHGRSAWASVPLCAIPVLCAGLPGAVEGRSGARVALCAYLLYALAPGLVLLYADQTSLLAHFLAAALIHLPLHLGALPKGLSATGDVTAWDTLTAALVALNSFSVVSPLERPVGFTFRGVPADVPLALICAVGALATGLLTAYAVGFAEFERPRRLNPAQQLAAVIGLYLSALCDEVLFRGVLLNLLVQWHGGEAYSAIALGCLLYGAAQLRKKKHEFNAPNWRFAVTSAVFGVFCGIAWTVSDRVPVAAFVNTVFHYALRTLLKKTSVE